MPRTPSTPADGGAAPPAPPGGRPGRPRRFEAGEERQRIFDAAFEVMRRNGYEDMTIGDILAEAGMSTRSFYRHFASKDELLGAMFRHDAEQFALAVERRVDAAGTPRRALDVWIDEILGFGVDRPRARRAAVLGSEAAMRALAPGELRRALDALVGVLATVLARGLEDGSFESVDPGGDARLVSGIAWETSTRIREAGDRAEREALRTNALSFVHRAVGAREV